MNLCKISSEPLRPSINKEGSYASYNREITPKITHMEAALKWLDHIQHVLAMDTKHYRYFNKRGPWNNGRL